MKEYLDGLKILADLGGASVIAVVVIVCIYRLLTNFAVAFIANMEKIATSMGEQARSIKDLSESLNETIAKDNAEHREILLSMQVVGGELKTLMQEIKCLREDIQK
ncbi:MAG: hypothetical protein KBH99_01185 [Syntrophobacteraceae bacterium]|nr:hypothetical protein [Syntrophobacteraceae bacterium]